MKSSTLRWLSLVETLAFSAFVSWYIWQLQASHFFSWMVFPVWMLASFLGHGDTPKTMGWRADNLWSSAKLSAFVFAPCIAGLCVVGILLGALLRPLHHLFVPRHFDEYIAFCLLQQVGLNSDLTNLLLPAPTRTSA